MTRARAQLVVGLLGIALWAAWYVPPLLRAAALPAEGELAALWGLHMLPLFVLLGGPLVGIEATYLLAFPAALVLPFAGAAAFGWRLAEPPQGGDLTLAAAAFLLYAVVAPLALRRSRAPRAEAQSRALRRRPARVARLLGNARAAAAALLPLALAYAAHFDRRLQIRLADSFGASAGFASVLVDLAALAAGVVAADLAFFAPLRSLRGRASPGEIAMEIEERLGVRTATRIGAAAAAVAAGLFLLALAGYLAVRP